MLPSPAGDTRAGIALDESEGMKNSNDQLQALDLVALTTVRGGVGFNSIRAKAQQHCPLTAQRYATVDPSSVTRGQAVKMGSQCLSEMGSFKASFARPIIQDAINSAFPQK